MNLCMFLHALQQANTQLNSIFKFLSNTKQIKIKFHASGALRQSLLVVGKLPSRQEARSKKRQCHQEHQ